MEQRVSEQPSRFRAREKAQDDRKPYRPPRVEVLGHLRDLTRGAHVGGLFEIGTYSAL